MIFICVFVLFLTTFEKIKRKVSRIKRVDRDKTNMEGYDRIITRNNQYYFIRSLSQRTEEQINDVVLTILMFSFFLFCVCFFFLPFSFSFNVQICFIYFLLTTSSNGIVKMSFSYLLLLLVTSTSRRSRYFVNENAIFIAVVNKRVIVYRSIYIRSF